MLFANTIKSSNGNARLIIKPYFKAKLMRSLI